MANSSLRERLSWWLIPSLVSILLVSAFWSYRNAIDAANHAYDRSLTTAIKGIAENIHASEGRVSVDIPYSAMDLFDESVQERIYYAVIGARGEALTGYDNLRIPPVIGADAGDPVMVDTDFGGQAIRMAVLVKRLYDPELRGGDRVTVVFAETTEARMRLALQLFFDSLRWQVLLLLSGLLLIVFALSRTFRPLLVLREAIRGRAAEDLTPVPTRGVPSEVLPLIDAINHHLGRQEKMLRARRRFLADAAHQIRTPLAVLGTQAEYGVRQSDPEEMRRTFASMRGCIRGTRHMANQMLTLARAEQSDGQIKERSRLDLAELVRDVAENFVVLALQKSIDLAFEGGAAALPISGNATMLREMVSNLVDNALRYTPDHGHVTLSLSGDGAAALLRVCDDGPGIPAAEAERVFERFYRILGNGESQGSGLGLCIVREISLAHGGTIQLCDGPAGRGLCVEIRLPVLVS